MMLNKMTTITVLSAILAPVVAASAAYTTDFSSPTVQSDFYTTSVSGVTPVTTAQIGMTGLVGNYNSYYGGYTWAPNGVTMSTRYGYNLGAVLNKTGAASDGVYSDTYSALNFSIVGTTDPSGHTSGVPGVRFGLSNRQRTISNSVEGSPGFNGRNTYPLYQVIYDGTNLVLREQSGYIGSGADNYANYNTLAFAAVTLSPTSQYRLEFDTVGGTNTAGVGGSATTAATLTARLFQDGSLVTTLTGVDVYDNTTGPGSSTIASDVADNWQDVHPAGQVGFYGGGTGDNLAGIRFTSFEVSSQPLSVPEPAGIATLGAVGMGMMLRRKRLV